MSKGVAGGSGWRDSEDTKSRWYSCAAHAIFGAMGGGMVDLKECLERSTDVGLDLPQLVYHVGDEDAAGVDQWANKPAYLTQGSPLSEPNCLTAFPSLDSHILPGPPRQAPPHSQSRPARGMVPCWSRRPGSTDFSPAWLPIVTGWNLSVSEAPTQEAPLWAEMINSRERHQDP